MPRAIVLPFTSRPPNRPRRPASALGVGVGHPEQPRLAESAGLLSRGSQVRALPGGFPYHRPMHVAPALTGAMAATTLLCVLTAGPAARAANRDLRWEPAYDRNLARELNGYARRGFRLAAISEGLPCEIAAVQAQEGEPRAFEYRVQSPLAVPADLEPLFADGWVPRGMTHGVGMDAVVLERATPRGPSKTWRAVAFESAATMERDLGRAAADGFRPRLVVRHPFEGLFGRGKAPGVVALAKVEGAGPRDTKVLRGSRRTLDDVAPAVAEATRGGWEVDLVYTPRATPDRREVAFALLSTARASPGRGALVRLSPMSIAMPTGRVLGIAPFFDGYVVATSDAFEPPYRFTTSERFLLVPENAKCPLLGTFRDFHPPRRTEHDVVALVARPSDRSAGGYDVLVVMDGVAGRP